MGENPDNTISQENLVETRRKQMKKEIIPVESWKAVEDLKSGNEKRAMVSVTIGMSGATEISEIMYKDIYEGILSHLYKIEEFNLEAWPKIVLSYNGNMVVHNPYMEKDMESIKTAYLNMRDKKIQDRGLEDICDAFKKEEALSCNANLLKYTLQSILHKKTEIPAYYLFTILKDELEKTLYAPVNEEIHEAVVQNYDDISKLVLKVQAGKINPQTLSKENKVFETYTYDDVRKELLIESIKRSNAK